MASDLPEEVDVVVLGTGMPESILAAAFSRNGYSVLHLDRNGFYGGGWASFHNVDLDKLCEERSNLVKEVTDERIAELTQEGERAVKLPVDASHISHSKTTYWCREEPLVEEVTEKVAECSVSSAPNEAKSGAPESPEGDAEAKAEVSDQDSRPQEAPPASESAKPGAEGVEEGQFDPAEEGGGDRGAAADLDQPQQDKPAGSRHVWCKEDLQRNFRRFSLDLAPKVLYSCGKMVELLISSDVSKYCDFRTVSCILTRLNHQLEKVPCSRADVFRTKRIPVRQKRPLMKFLTFCANYESQPEEYRDFVGKPFTEFLDSKGFSPELKHFFQFPMAMATNTTPTEEGLHSIQKFIKSMGRYGNSSFLFPLYGAGELPQGFCRLSAVFGGTYCLQTTVVAMLLDENNKCKAVITSEGQRIGCKWVVMEASYSPPDYVQYTPAQISRGILVTDRTLSPEDDQELSLLHLPVDAEPERPITVLELPSSSMVCPQHMYVVHLTRVGSGDAEADLQPAVQTLFTPESEAAEEDPRPRMLWGAFLSMPDLSTAAQTRNTPSNVLILPGPGPEFDMDAPVDEARQLFETVLPGEQFLPKPPHPDDIIFVDDEETPAGGREGEGQAGWQEERRDEEKKEEQMVASATQTSPAEGEGATPTEPAGKEEQAGKEEAAEKEEAGKEEEAAQSDQNVEKMGDATKREGDPNQGSS